MSVKQQNTVPEAGAVHKPKFWIPLAIIALAFLFRIAWLEIKPAHFDEGVNGWFVDQMTSQGYYHYDPGNFHGPLHFYVLFVSQTLLGRDVWNLRLPIVVVSTACVAMMFAFRRFFNRDACTIAALAMAISPGMVFYGRYSIHESWLLFFLLLTVWGILGLWKDGSRRDLWAVAIGVTGMILTKETYAIHVISLLLAFPTLWILERISPSASAPRSRQRWSKRDLISSLLVSLGLIVFFYTGGFLDWPDFRQPSGSVGSLAGLWETFTKWASTGTGGHTGHEKPWAYWLELLARYEWPAAAGFVAMFFLVLRRRENRMLRYLAIAGTGTLTAYSIIAYKTPWCLIVMMWPFLIIFGEALILAYRNIDRSVSVGVGILLLGGSFLNSAQLNFRNYTNENEPYVYVQTLPDINKLMHPLEALTRVSPANYHIQGYILLSENDCHPLSWLLAPYSRVQFLDVAVPPADMHAAFLLVEDSIVSDIEERLQTAYFKEPFILRGSWGNSATLYLNASVFGHLFPGRTPEFVPQPATDSSAESSSSDTVDQNEPETPPAATPEQ